MAVTISATGDVTGTIHDSTAGTNGTVAGGVNLTTGDFDSTVMFPGLADAFLSGPLTVSGNTITGSLTQQRGGTTVNVSVTLQR